MSPSDEARKAILLKYLVAFQELPDEAFDEAMAELNKVIAFHSERSPQQPISAATRVKGKIVSVRVRPPIVLESGDWEPSQKDLVSEG